MTAITLDSQQQQAFEKIRSFTAGEQHCFILSGSAGTGKTTLVAKIVKQLRHDKRAFSLLAPTGRAARILGAKARQDARTIHSVIYSFANLEVFEEVESANDPGMRLHFPLKTDDPGEQIFIIDKASMVADVENEQDLLRFGSGRLLADLIAFARTHRPGRSGGAKLLFVGDSAQLPPMGQTLSPALSADYLQKEFGLACADCELTEVMRQQAGSAILDRATALREAIQAKMFNAFDLSPAGEDIVGASLIESVSLVTEAHRSRGASAVLITLSNAQALRLNRAVRERLWSDKELDLHAGDILLVNRNSPRLGLFNGDLVKAVEVAPEPERRIARMKGIANPVELVFRRAAVAYRAANGAAVRIECLLLENLLNSSERALTPLEQRALLVDFRQRHPNLRPHTAAFEMAVLDDPYFNALQVKYGYAITCHKAQGGEWDTVVVDFGDQRGQRNEDFFRWAYTAITRAKTRLVIIGAPRFDPYSGIDWDAWPGPAELKAEPVPISDPRADPDWNRFSFVAGQEAIFEHHRKLREEWAARSIRIESLDHGQHYVRYWLSRAGKQAVVQFWYKGDGRVSRVQRAPGQLRNDAFADDALDAMKGALIGDGVTQGVVESEFVCAFRERVEKSIAGTGIRLVSSQPMQYRLRLEFEWVGRRSKIDFLQDSTPKWTRAEEVGGLGSSRGLIERLRQLLQG
jgi:hypothetical protein